jgi:hypothetical protein
MNQTIRKETIKRLKFKNDSERLDLLNPELTSDNLLAALNYISNMHSIIITSVRTDHGDDSTLGPHCHAHGYAVDFAPQNDEDVRALCSAVSRAPHVESVGLGGFYYTANNMAALYPFGFLDNNQPHIHVQVFLPNGS